MFSCRNIWILITETNLIFKNFKLEFYEVLRKILSIKTPNNLINSKIKKKKYPL